MPSRLGRYAVRRRLGSGAFATVWLAYDEQLDSPVAVKVLADNWTEDLHVRRRFLDEGRLLRRVESPHVVSVHDAGELDDGRPYLVMTYADQGTLADRLALESLTPAQALEVVAQVGAGLSALHDCDVLHRDVKPANVLFRSSSGRVRAMLGDLGLGKALDGSSRLTMVGGTPTYVAPEQALGERLDGRADQYSLGVLTYLLLAGRPPYAHGSLGAATEPGPPDPLTGPSGPYPDPVDAVVRRALARDRDDRWPDVRSFVAALEEALAPVVDQRAPASVLPLDPELTQPGARPSAVAGNRTGEPTEPPATVPAGRSRGRRALVAAATVVGAVAVLATGAAGGLAWQRSADAEPVTVDDAAGALSVTVPAAWHRAVATGPWEPPDAEREYPALSVGDGADWTTQGGQGVFVGMLPGDELPERLPQHPECEDAEEPVSDALSGSVTGSATTVVHTGCPGGVTVERVVQVAENRLLWVQVRSADRATANRVLDGVETHGI